jgi:hypothetical protein
MLERFYICIFIPTSSGVLLMLQHTMPNDTTFSMLNWDEPDCRFRSLRVEVRDDVHERYSSHTSVYSPIMHLRGTSIIYTVSKPKHTCKSDPVNANVSLPPSFGYIPGEKGIQV